MEQLDIVFGKQRAPWARHRTYPSPAAIFRLLARVTVPFEEDDGESGKHGSCWEIDGRKDPDGYGHFYLRLKGGKLETRAHRSAWILNYGPVPPDLRVLHKCDNPPCVRVAHLFLGTDADNMHDRARKWRHPHGEGHPKAKLTDADVVALRSLAAGGKGCTELGALFGVSAAVASKIILRKAWVHVP